MENHKPGKIYGLAAVILPSIILLRLLWYGIGADQGWYSYCAWVWRDFGQMPYRDVFEQNFPGIILIHYFIQAILGQSITAFRIFDFAWQVAAAAMVYLVAASIFKNRLAGFLSSTLYAIYYLNLGPWHTGQRDGFLLLLYLASFEIFMQKAEARTKVYPLLAGLLMGFAFLIKPVAALVGLVLFAMAIKTAHRKALAASLFLAGCMAPSLAIIFYYWRVHGLHDLYVCLFYYTGKIYVDYQLVDRLKLIAGVVMLKNFLTNIFILAGAAIWVPLRKKAGAEQRNWPFWLFLVLLASYIGYLSQAKYAYDFYYHEAPVWGALCLFSGAGWALGIDFVNRKLHALGRIKTVAISGLLVLLSLRFMWSDNRSYLWEALSSGPSHGQEMYLYQQLCQDAARYIRINSTPEDTLQVWGGEVIVNYFAARRAPSRFPNTLHLIPFRPGPGSPIQKEFAGELLSEIKRNPPLYFVVMHLPYFDNQDIADVLTDDYPELWQFVQTHYTHAATVKRFEIYRLKK